MKFLAVLKDSLREAIDTKVFYVMVGLSALLTLLAATITFTPKPGGKEIMQAASAPLNFDDLADLQAMSPEDLVRVFQHNPRDLYQVVEVEPLGGAPDVPDSTFRVVLRCLPLKASAGGGRTTTEEVADLIRRRFGAIDNLRLVEVGDVHKTGRPASVKDHTPGQLYYEVTARPTPAARRWWPHTFSLFFGGLPLGDAGVPLGLQLFVIENYVVGGLGAWIAVLISVIITAFFIPNMLHKGTVDLLLVKPIHRTTLLLYKFVGGLTFIFLTTAAAVVGIWVALGLRSGVWAPSFLLMIPVLTFSFAVLYAVSALFGVLTRSAVVAILITCAVWFLLFITGTVYGYIEGRRQQEVRQNVPAADRVSEGVFAKVVYAVHFVLPRRGDIDALTQRVLVQDLLTDNQIKLSKLDPTPISWGESLTVSCGFIAVMLGLACWRFATKDY